jgi:hypothetical protein
MTRLLRRSAIGLLAGLVASLALAAIMSSIAIDRPTIIMG